MKVAVIGPGAMGCVFAAKLSQGGVSVRLVDHRPDRAARLNESGITVERDGQTYTYPIPVDTAVPPGQDLYIVLTKSHATQSLSIPSESPVLTLQNGLGNTDTLCASVGASRVLAGVTSEAAHLIGEGRVRHVASGLTRFGPWTGCPPDVALDALTAGGFDVELTDAPGQVIWEKVAVNAGINPITALLDVPNGALLENRATRELMRDLVVEAVKVAATEGYRFEYSLIERAEQVCAETRENISSMLQDVRAGRKTEIDYISGEILRRAQICALPIPRTRVVWQLVKGLEAR